MNDLDTETETRLDQDDWSRLTNTIWELCVFLREIEDENIAA